MVTYMATSQPFTDPSLSREFHHDHTWLARNLALTLATTREKSFQPLPVPCCPTSRPLSEFWPSTLCAGQKVSSCVAGVTGSISALRNSENASRTYRWYHISIINVAGAIEFSEIAYSGTRPFPSPTSTVRHTGVRTARTLFATESKRTILSNKAVERRSL